MGSTTEKLYETSADRVAKEDGAERRFVDQTPDDIERVGRKLDKAAAEGPAQIQISRLDIRTMEVPIIGTAPLIVHQFSEKAKRQMLDAMQGRKTPKEPKDPEAEYRAAFYELRSSTEADPKYGFPVIAFKAATIGGARFYSGVTMTSLRQCMFFRGELGKNGQQMAWIQGTPQMREDVVRVNRGGSDLRYRPIFENWRTTLKVSYVASMLTQGSILSLIDAGGLGVGVGEWRIERSGDFGTYMVDPDADVVLLG